MQPQDAPTAFLLKLWPWIEANRIRLVVGAGIVIVAIFFYTFFSYQREQNEITAGRAMSRLLVVLPSETGANQWADSFLKIAGEYPDTLAGRRAWLQGATALYAAGKYVEAQAQFQKFLDAHPDGEFSASAVLGVAASLEALGKLDLAVGAYQRVVNGFSADVVAVNAAKFALARISVRQGKVTDALNFYDSIARSSPGSPLAQEATLREIELKAKSAPAPPVVVEP